MLVLNDPRLPERFWKKVEQDARSGCWNWSGYRDPLGYGRFRHEGRVERPYRVTFAAAGGRLISGLCLDHLCRNPSCVNPKHLEQVTSAENTRRGRSGAPQRERTHCPRGHAYTAGNMYPTRTGERVCKACSQNYSREYQRRRRASLRKAS